MSFWQDEEEDQVQEEVPKADPKPTQSRPKETPKQTSKKKMVVRITPKKEFEKLELNKELEFLAKTSDFKRLVYRAIFGKSHREGGNKSLDKELYHALKKIRGLK